MRDNYCTAVRNFILLSELPDPLGPERRAEINRLIRSGATYRDALYLTSASVKKQ